MRYVVLEPPPAKGEEAVLRSEHAVFVRDGFARWAVVFPYLWLARHRLFLASFLTFAVAVALGFLGKVPGFGFSAAALELLLGVFVALEGASLRIGRLQRLGYREAGAVHAGNVAEADMLYYAGETPAPILPPARPQATSAAPKTDQAPRGYFGRRKSLLDPAASRG